MRRRVVLRLVGSGRAMAIAFVATSCGRVGYDTIDLHPHGAQDADADVSGPDAGAGGSSLQGSAVTSSSTTVGGGGVGSGGASGTAGFGGAGSSGSDGGEDSGAVDSGETEAGPSCPTSISLSGATQTPLRGGTGGSLYSADACPAGQVVVGFILSEDTSPPASVGKMQVVCGAISITQTSCQVAISPGATLPLRGSQATQPPVTQVCPANQVVVAIQGGAGQYLDRVGAGCAPLTLSPAGSTYQMTIGAITWFMPVGGTGGIAFSDACPADQIASGTFVRSGADIDAMALGCSSPVLTP